MKLLAFVDTHEEDVFPRFKRIIKKHNVDLAVCAGDFTIFGNGTRQILDEMNNLGVPVVFVHGNHEDEDEIEELIDSYENLHWAHDTVVDILGLRFIGFGGHGFSQREPDLEELEERLADSFHEKTIFISHPPPYASLLDEAEQGWHVGCESLTELISRRFPLLVLCGHIHQCFHVHDRVAGVLVVNPGPDGEILEVDV